MKKLILMFSAIAIMASCTKTDEVIPTGTDGQVEIKLKSTALSIDATSRAAFEGPISGTHNLIAKVLASAITGNYATLYANGNMTFTDNGTNAVGYSTTKYYYPANDDVLYFCGLYPADATWGTFGTTTTLTFSGKEDVMAAAETSGKKSLAQAATPTHPSLTFNHLLTKLVVLVKADDTDAEATAAAAAAWGKVTGITLIKADGADPLSVVTVDLKTGAATSFGTDVASFPFYVRNTDSPFTTSDVLTDTPEEVAYSIVAPITATGTNDFRLKVITEKHTTGVEVPLGVTVGATKGKSYAITLTFKATEIKATATVVAWADGGATGVEIE